VSDCEVLLANASGLSSADEAHADLYGCMRHSEVDACWFRSEEGDHGRGISSSTAAGDNNGDNDDGNLNCCLLSNKWLKVTDNGGKRSGCKSDGRIMPTLGKESETTMTET
jgi:hypothetical protein